MAAQNGGGNADGDLEEKQENLGEYGQLVRYISTYRDGRAMSVAGNDDEVPKKKRWWSRKAKGGSDGSGFETPPDWLNTHWKQGLASADVETRRKKTGWNELTTEKENLFLKFLGFFTGPILYGLSVFNTCKSSIDKILSYGNRCSPRRWSARLD
jgi:H+-transporting ATPase